MELKNKEFEGYRIRRSIGHGAFGEVFEAVHKTKRRKAAIKCESRSCRHPQLENEYRMYKILVDCVGMPQVKHFGQAHGCSMLVMDLLGPSLESRFNECGRRFSMKTVLMLADQMVARVEMLHSKNYLHRDIKPDNFCMGTGKNTHVLYMIDYGLVKRYRHPKTHRHIPFKQGKNLTGTARYASICTHLGYEQSRRDDLESVGFVLIYFLRGCLPWQGLKVKGTKQNHYNKISEKKQMISSEMLCEGLPNEFVDYFYYVRNLQFDQKPDYNWMRRSFRDLFYRLGYAPDYGYDWCR